MQFNILEYVIHYFGIRNLIFGICNIMLLYMQLNIFCTSKAIEGQKGKVV